jgi:IS4 transposase
MVLDAVLKRFVDQSPATVMARLALQRALEPEWIDELFEQHRQSQYTRELLFSTTVEIMSVVAVGLRPSLHAAAQALADSLPVSITALYDKINRTEPAVVRALVGGSASRLHPVLKPMLQQQPATVPGWRVRIIDGNHLAASEKRLKPLRGFRGAALPGQSLVVYDPDLDMIVDMVPCEDGHTQERALMEPILESAKRGELWVADRNFCTRKILAGWHGRGSGFIVREHGSNPNPTEVDRPRKAGRAETGIVYEQAVSIDDNNDQPLVLRRIEVRLKHPTEDGDTVIRLLTNLPASEFSACEIARLYRRRWRIETMFQRLESVLNSEIAALGHPRAALLAFGIAALAYNVLAVISAAVKRQHQLDATKLELSAYFIAMEVKANYAGMMIAIAPELWQPFDRMTAVQLSRTLLAIAAHVNPRTLRKHPRAPKPPSRKGYAAARDVKRHVATARVIKEGKVVLRP